MVPDVGGTGSTGVGRSEEGGVSWWRFLGPRRGVFARAGFIVHAPGALTPVHACRARMLSVAFLWVELILAFLVFSSVVTHALLLSDYKMITSVQIP